MLALPACIVQPGNAGVIAFFQTNHSRSASHNNPGTFMTGDERQRRLYRPIAVGGTGEAPAGE
jgi:hypothetical protein